MNASNQAVFGSKIARMPPINPFLNPQRELRNGWWVLIFFGVLAALLVPLIVIAHNEAPPSVSLQAAIVAAASFICQLLRRRPISELAGRPNWQWPKQLLLGSLLGALLMIVPAAFLSVFGYVRWHWIGMDASDVASAILLWSSVAVTEELVFRGFVFQRLIDGLGRWAAQLILACYFVLIHSATLGSAGQQKYLAGANIFIASLLFGLAFIRTASLAMPLGMHFAANFMQGTVLGLGVSGADQPGMLRPVLRGGTNWMTGGAFGLEASVPGLVCVAAAALMLYRWAPKDGRQSLPPRPTRTIGQA
jgi:membrane protease YdiL (CAAX protease family)